MADRLNRYTDRQEAELNRKIEQIYADAGRKAQALTDAYMKPFQAESERRLKQVEAGEITKADYQLWLQTEVLTGPAWERTASQIAQIYVDADAQARELTGVTTRQTYGAALEYTADAIGKAAPKAVRGGISFDLYDQHAVDRMLKENPQTLPEWKIDEKKDYTWNYQRVKNTIAQGIVSGESVHKIGQRLTGELAARNAKKMEMFARTALTGAENAGRVERLKETEAQGIRVLKKWLAVHDARTRDAHAALDGQTRKPDEDFDSELGPIKYPGDPTADPANVYNCRCTLVYVYPDFD